MDQNYRGPRLEVGPEEAKKFRRVYYGNPYYVQRDLEDQIAEELEIIKNTNMAEQKTVPAPPKVVIPEVKRMLDAGYTRYKKDDRGYGSVQGHYNLSFSQVKEVFAHDSLKGLKTKYPKVIILEAPEEEATVAPEKKEDPFA